MGRGLKRGDARVHSSAMREGVPVMIKHAFHEGDWASLSSGSVQRCPRDAHVSFLPRRRRCCCPV